MADTISLVLETSTPHASLARIGPDGQIEHRAFCSDRSHNARLFAPLAELLRDTEPQGIGLVLVGSGPGSYSGTRVGIAAAQGVAIAAACPAVAVPSILAVPSADNGGACLAIGDARRGSFWSARMGNFRITEEPALCDATGLVDIIGTAVAEGIAVVSFEEASRFQLPNDLAGFVRQEFPDASRLWQAWCRTDAHSRKSWTDAIPQPLYLKPPHITPTRRPALPRF